MPSYSGTFTLTAQMQAIAAGTWTAPPDAPTSVVATGGDAQASVAFTAPAFTGVPAGVTGYTVTSSPGSLTGTGASSPIIVTGLTNGTAYTFTVTATGASGVGSPSAASNSVSPANPAPTVIGQSFGGGFYAGQISTAGNSVADYYLIVGPVASAENASKKYKNTNTSVPGAASVIEGPQNTADMVADGDATVYPAAHFCDGLTIGGFSDWYLPAKLEIEVCYYNLKPTTANNETSANGINAYAVPARASKYTTGTPAQTSATSFQSTGTEDFLVSNYWTSTDPFASFGFVEYFGSGSIGYASKTGAYRVRAIRRIAV